MRRWESPFILKESEVIPGPSHQPVRLQMEEDICGIIQKMNRGILPVWTLISLKTKQKRNHKKESPKSGSSPDCSYFTLFGEVINGSKKLTRYK